MKYLSISEQNNFLKPVSIQNGYNLINRVFDISNSEISIRENCGLIAYSPFAGGRLTGKYLTAKDQLMQGILYGLVDFQGTIRLGGKKQFYNI